MTSQISQGSVATDLTVRQQIIQQLLVIEIGQHLPSCSKKLGVGVFSDSQCITSTLGSSTLLLQGLVVDVAVVTSCRHAALSCAHRLADARPRFIGRRSVSTVLSQVCLGRPVLRLHSPAGPMMQAWRVR